MMSTVETCGGRGRKSLKVPKGIEREGNESGGRSEERQKEEGVRGERSVKLQWRERGRKGMYTELLGGEENGKGRSMFDTTSGNGLKSRGEKCSAVSWFGLKSRTSCNPR